MFFFFGRSFLYFVFLVFVLLVRLFVFSRYGFWFRRRFLSLGSGFFRFLFEVDRGEFLRIF